MKVLKKKLKKVHVVKKFFYYFTILLYTLLYAYFVYGILKLENIETVIRYIVIGLFGVWLLVYIFCGLITMIAKKTKSFVFITILSLLFCPVFGVSSYYINKIYGSLTNINNEMITYTTNLIAMKETNFNENMTIGMINAEDDIEGNVLAKKLISKENLGNKIEVYEDYHSMISDLYKGKIGACFVSGNYAIQFEDESFEEVPEGQEVVSIVKRVKVLKTYSEDRKNQDNVTLQGSKKKTLTEPFTVLVMGVDSAMDGLKANQAFNGDTLILVTFNPNTLTATMFSIPRDMYVPIACNHNRYAKINSSAAYGSSCVINTVKQMTGIDIDYYVKINFTGVVELVDALGGVVVDVEEPDFKFNLSRDCKGMICEQNSRRQFGDNMVYVPIGVQTLNGEQALAYARNRHQFATSDIARNQHQQQVIEAMAQQLKGIRTLSDFEKILKTVEKNIETNMTPQQILSFYNVGKDMLANTSTTTLSIKKTYLSYYNLNPYLPRSGMRTSALGYYQESLDAITKLMRVNLGLEKEEVVKTFSISYNEDYTTPIVGKGLTGGGKLELLPSFIGDNQFDANAWCQLHSLSCSFEAQESALEYGTIVDQSAHEGELVKSLSTITFYYSDGTGTPITEPEDPTGNEEDPGNNENPGENTGDENDPENNQGENGSSEGEEKPGEGEKPSTGDGNDQKPEEKDPLHEIGIIPSE